MILAHSQPKQPSPVKTPEQRPSQNAPKRRKKRESVDLIRRPLALRPQRKTLVLDLDETLIHSMSRSTRLGGSHMVEVELGKLSCIYFVEKRPYCDYFLNTVREWYDLVVFTASVKSYADPMIDWLDQGRNYFSKRLYRDHCISTASGFVKDLTILDQHLGKVILVDNSPISFVLQKDNGVGIQGWISDPSDTCLLHLLPLLNALRYTSDVRSLLCLQRGSDFSQSESQPGLEPGIDELAADAIFSDGDKSDAEGGRDRSDSMSD